MTENEQHIIEIFDENREGMDFANPRVYCFAKEYAAAFERLPALLQEKGFRVIDVNQALVFTAEDYQKPAKQAGLFFYKGDETIDEICSTDADKQKWLAYGKLNLIARAVDRNTVLVVRYNERILHDEETYETIRRWLKDGMIRDGQDALRSINAIVYFEISEKREDFCAYGFWVKDD